MATNGDVAILRDLAKQYAALCRKDVQNERRDLWRKHNSLVRTKPLIYTRWTACSNEVTDPLLRCEDDFYRGYERWLRNMIFQDALEDDLILEPWIAVRAVYAQPANAVWGPAIRHIPTTQPGGSWKFNPPIRDLDDIRNLVKPHHAINEEETARRAARLHDAVGDIVPVVVDRAPLFRVWHADISYDVTQLRGMDQLMWDMYDNAEWLHGLLAFLRDGILQAQEEAEKAGDWRLFNHENQAMSYALELEDPKADDGPVTRARLWDFCAAQEYALVSPQLHEEFLLQYQLPIMEKFALVAYGCCEDLTNKIDMLRQIPNLRRIAVTPRADVRRSAEQIGTDYVFSWRPNPAEMVCCGFDPDHVRKVIREGLAAAKGCHVDITLKDVQTVESEPQRLREWVRIVREETERSA